MRDFTGEFAFAILAGAVLTPFLSWVALGRYRAAVARSMKRRVGEPPPLPIPPPLPAASAHPLSIDVAEPPGDPGAGVQIIREIHANRRRLATIFLFAGLAQAIAMTICVFTLNDIPFLPLRTLAVLAVMLWPTAIAISTAFVTSRRVKLAAPALLFLISQILGIGLNREIAHLWAAVALPPMLFWFLIGNRRLKAVGPFVMLVVFAFVVGANVGISVGFPLAEARNDVTIFFAVARKYAGKGTSDQAITLDAMFLSFTVCETLLLLLPDSSLGALGLLTFLPYKITAVLGHHFARNATRLHEPYPILLLRTFGFRNRSEQLLEEVGGRWRHVGPIQLIAGPDVATANLEPHEFLSFVSGRLSRAFVRDAADLESRLARLDTQPDPDSRYRINEFFCYADTWQQAVVRLSANARAIVMDLRGFTREKRGCVFELQHLFREALLARVRFIIDRTTDESFLRQVLEETPRPAASSEERIRLLRVESNSAAEIRFLVTEIADAVGNQPAPP